MNSSPLKNRLFWPDLVRAFAISCVVGVHVSGGIMNAGFFAVSPLSWWFAATLNCIGRYGVPLFFMLSGALLISKVQTEPAGTFLKKRMLRILISFFVWSILYLLLRSLKSHTTLSAGNVLSILKTPAYYHLWFYYSLIGLYLFAPILRFAAKPVLLYAEVLWLISIPIMFFLSRIFHLEINGNFTGVLPYYFGFFIFGILLKDLIINRNQVMILCMIVIIITIVSVMATGYLTYHNKGVLDGFYFNYVNINIVLNSILLFLILRYFGEKPFSSSLLSAGVRTISCSGLGIFVIHVMFLELMSSGIMGFKLSSFTWHPIAGIPVTFIVVMILSTIVITLISKIPYLKSIV